MRRLSWWIGGSVFVLTLGALISRQTVELWPLFVIAALFGFIGWASEHPSVRQRFSILHTPAMKFREVYDDLNLIRGPLRAYVHTKEVLTPRHEWEPKVVAWDLSFWNLVDDLFYAQGGSFRHLEPKITYVTDGQHDTDWGWAVATVKFLDTRRAVLDKLMKELPKA